MQVRTLRVSLLQEENGELVAQTVAGEYLTPGHGGAGRKGGSGHNAPFRPVLCRGAPKIPFYCGTKQCRVSIICPRNIGTVCGVCVVFCQILLDRDRFEKSFKHQNNIYKPLVEKRLHEGRLPVCE